MITNEMKSAADSHLRSVAGDVPDRVTAEMVIEQFLSDNYRDHIESLTEVREFSAELAERYY